MKALQRKHSILRNVTGVSMIELMVAAVMLAAAGACIAILFPRITKSTVQSRELSIGHNIAIEKLEEIQKSAYAVITPTPIIPADLFQYTNNTDSTKPGCDCHTFGADQMQALPSNATLINNQPAGDTITQNNVVFTRSVCVNQLQGSEPIGGSGKPQPQWRSLCSGITGWQETGMKYVRVRVTWATGNSNSGSGNAGSAEVDSVVSE